MEKQKFMNREIFSIVVCPPVIGMGRRMSLFLAYFIFKKIKFYKYPLINPVKIFPVDFNKLLDNLFYFLYNINAPLKK